MSLQPYSPLLSWSGDILNATDVEVVQCHADMVGINLLAKDGTIFAHAHFDLETCGEFLAFLAQTLREAQGTTVQ